MGKGKEYTLQGLVFWPEKAVRKAGNFYPSVYAWATGGKPDNAVIYDTIDVLIDCGIPVCDATEFNGLFRRVPVPLGPQKVRVTLSKKLVVPTHPAKGDKTVKSIMKADAKDHHKMNYQ